MSLDWIRLCWRLKIFSCLAVIVALTSSRICALGQILPDNTLGNNNSVVTPAGDVDATSVISGGVTRDTNLFHSFEQFSVPTGGTAHFNNAANIQNIISRVTGKSLSNIDGLIRANGSANLFLINPNGIIFGPNASLAIGGSFLASTATSLNFADGSQFSAVDSLTTPPLLTVSVPTGLQLGAIAGNIRNQAQGTGLQVQPGKTLAIVSSGIVLAGGKLTTRGGRLELGSVTANSLVHLKPTAQGWTLDYQDAPDFQDISFRQGAVADASSGGQMQLQGRHVTLTDGAQILSENDETKNTGSITINANRLVVTDGAQVSTATSGESNAGTLTINALESVELVGVTPFAALSTATYGSGDAGALTINTGKLIVQDGAQVFTLSDGSGASGRLTVFATEVVELKGVAGAAPDGANSGLFSSAINSGAAGNITIKTARLLMQDQAVISTESAEPTAAPSTPATGAGGNLNIDATESVTLVASDMSTGTFGLADAGDIEIRTRNLQLRDGSKISTEAGTEGGPGNGGNITIDTDTLVGLENSDITANAYEGAGGLITITAQGIFGIEARAPQDDTSDISAVSLQNPSLDGEVEINRLEYDPTRGLLILPVELVDVSRLVAQGCSAGGSNVRGYTSEFIVTGRGGLPPTPTEALKNEPALADLGTPVQRQSNRNGDTVARNSTSAESAAIVEAQAWVINPKGEVVLIAQAPTVTPYIPWLKPTTCNASY